jgi:hypothetical protein
MLPQNDPNAVVVGSYAELSIALKNERVYLAFCEEYDVTDDIQGLLDILAASNIPFYLCHSKNSSRVLFEFGKYLNYTKKEKAMQAATQYFSHHLEEMSSYQVTMLVHFLFDEVERNICLISENFLAEDGYFSYISTAQCNARDVWFAPNWHQDNNKYVVLSNYTGVSTRYVPRSFPKHLIMGGNSYDAIIGNQNLEYRLPNKGKSMHKGMNLVTDENSPCHLGEKADHRIIGVAGTYNY